MRNITDWVEKTLGHKPQDQALFERALTHSSRGDEHYERLEFLGDRVLGLTVATWLYELFPDEPEGKMSRRLNALVSGETCAEIAREIGVGGQVILGKQARDDGAADSDNVLGDVVEALIGALYLEAGLEEAARFIRSAWGDRVSTHDRAPKHPKSELQEWAAANNRRAPDYRMVGRSGPHHAPRFSVEVEIKGAGTATAEGLSKQEAETEAAKALLEKLK
ncbi:MAG TPA: ribonuclease III [Allosphingosinicella sp.]|uniref:ribonuclease III n=1 Tax=Allosphingosinicella sp. TaxID=2823234 RepID=UPI002EDAD0D0